MITLTDSAGTPLPNISVGPEEQQADGTWASPQYGPITTDNVGQLFWQTVAGHKYRFCFADNLYTKDNQPTNRYKSACYSSAAFDPNAATVLTGTSSVQNITQVLALDGLSMTATNPWVTGTPSVGSTLTVADTGIAAPTDATISYQWNYWDSATRQDVPISGATGSSYVVTADMAGKWPSVKVTATKAGYATVSMQDGAGTIGGKTPTSATALRITGTVAVGQTLTAAWGAFSPAPSGYYTPMYTWFVGGRQVTDTTDAATYVVKAADQGKVIAVRGEYYNWDAGMDNALKGFAATAPVLGALTAPTPTISGSAVVGSVLTAKPGTWGPAPVTLAYRWYRYTSTGWVAITGATAATYTVTTSDQGKKLLVKVTGSKTGYLTTARNSASTAAVLGKLTVGTPSISGTARVGYTLTAKTGTWGPSPVTFHYQWYRVTPSTGALTAITGATGSTFKPTTAQKGYGIKVRVTGLKTGYQSVAKYTSATAKVY